MVHIRNLKFQPLALHLANSKRTVHLPPRGRREIDDGDVSQEMRRAADRGFIALTTVAPRTERPRRRLAPAPAPTDTNDKEGS